MGEMRRASPNASTKLLKNGEPVGIRTRDLLIKSQLLYRLSYGLAAPREHKRRRRVGQSTVAFS